MVDKHETDWEAIKKVTGLDDDFLATIQKNWARPPQTTDEVRQGVLDERDRREKSYSAWAKKEKQTKTKAKRKGK